MKREKFNENKIPEDKKFVLRKRELKAKITYLLKTFCPLGANNEIDSGSTLNLHDLLDKYYKTKKDVTE